MTFEKERKILIDNILEISESGNFDETLALKIFNFQYRQNELYAEYCDYLKRTPSKVKSVSDLPFLPVTFFKSHTVLCRGINPKTVFRSSGTTGMDRSKHHVADLDLYNRCASNTFHNFYGALQDFAILALLPSYLDEKQSSLVFMAENFIQQSENQYSGFFQKNQKDLLKTLENAQKMGLKVLLLGVTYALLDLVEIFDKSLLNNLIIMETGGMKGRRRELIRQELHEILTAGFGVEKIHSEYGMTELLSQAYSQGDGIFYPAGTMKILIRDTNDPLSLESHGRIGGVNIIDLANIDSCSFIATQDLGKLNADGSFEILGRFDNSDIRGCNLLVV